MGLDRPFACSACSQTFTRNENLVRHRRSRHGDSTCNKPYACFSCNASFSRRDVCKRHVERCRGTPAHPSRGEASEEAIRETIRIQNSSVSPQEVFTSPKVAVISPENHRNSWGNTLSDVSPPDNGFLKTSYDSHISAYFEYFHTSFPLLHRSTALSTCPQSLKSMVLAIGSVYSARKLPEDGIASGLRESRDVWETVYAHLYTIMDSDWQNLRKPGVIQASILCIIYGAYMGEPSHYSKARKMLRALVDASQELGLLTQTLVLVSPRSWIQPYDDSPNNHAPSLHENWMSYVEEEAMKLAIYSLLFLDFHIFYPCNIRSITSSMDMDWELPFSSMLWEAENEVVWMRSLNDDSRVKRLRESATDFSLICPTTKSLTLAMQSLMSDSPRPALLTALAASPFTTLFVLTSIDALVRDFTRSYYQLPPNLADPSAYHILTQTQTRQVVAALKHILRLSTDQDIHWDAKNQPLWTTIQRMVLDVRISLCKPDDLLIGGIVDSNIFAGLATATHLALGQYSGSRRSLQSLLDNITGDDVILVMLDDISDVLHQVLGENRQDAFSEAPWTSVATYRVILTVWRSLRWAAGQVRDKNGGEEPVPSLERRFTVPNVVLNAIMEAVLSEQERMVQRTAYVMAPSMSEVRFKEAVLQFWKERSVWAIGPFMENLVADPACDSFALLPVE
uniref:C2H2-type domain-containing protein n=1 Tax=Bionectria ochroleuca TaxID=29856 RepID=A0A8H7KF37_BIOOC